MQPAFDRLREEMVERQIRARGVTSPRVLHAMGRVHRERYVPLKLSARAYEDSALPIEQGQSISQPYIVAVMLAALDLGGDERVLEIGTGSGYAAAVLAELAREVYTIERHEGLARTAADRLEQDGCANVHVKHGDGTLGWPEQAPFDAIVVAAGGPRVPESLRQQLAIGGRLVMPVGDGAGGQRLERISRTAADKYEQESMASVRFVPLVGAQGWRDPGKSSNDPGPVPPVRPAGSGSG